ncbi:MAG: hypothetical protein U9N36_10700 [Euryarchaeota archaeon]|nr:hypothetical protein [Euryarchaeota archaeon]
MQTDRRPEAMGKTVIFEEKYGVAIEKFSTTSDIVKFIEDKIGRELQVIEPCGHGIVSTRGNVFKLRDYDINRMFDETINL